MSARPLSAFTLCRGCSAQGSLGECAGCRANRAMIEYLDGEVFRLEAELKAIAGRRLAVEPEYATLAAVLDEALAQAQSGKGAGAERHAGEGEAFVDQQIVQLCEWMGSIQGDVFQVCKKSLEATRLPPDRARSELLGAINYAAAAVLVLERARPASVAAAPLFTKEEIAQAQRELAEELAKMVDRRSDP